MKYVNTGIQTSEVVSTFRIQSVAKQISPEVTSGFLTKNVYAGRIRMRIKFLSTMWLAMYSISAT